MRYLIILAVTAACLNFNKTFKHLPTWYTHATGMANAGLATTKFSGDEIAVYNKAGVVIGWIQNSIIFNYEGSKALAFIDKQDVFAFGGNNTYLGRFHNGFFRDKAGNAVAWVRGASDGPITLPPLDRVAPIFMPVIKPITPIIVTITPIETYSWSNLSWADFMGQ
ncbi:4-fold beta flower protein [Mucilaginibacter ginsenosidivorax]|uniref:4-fold beta flower domain-containing protein n=1 Tax=Mucilaginibacter ginsenosidivorax TaxID=862126 RepID=A0A5B8W2A3_9SPHI|nr:hypothetical protein [Mucilaginibacter ginsenosidivorax]QEC78190.1 hypothetical protein FSB76_20440 [Mucilaginibacter ginsenosidivorax]